MSIIFDFATSIKSGHEPFNSQIYSQSFIHARLLKAREYAWPQVARFVKFFILAFEYRGPQTPSWNGGYRSVTRMNA